MRKVVKYVVAIAGFPIYLVITLLSGLVLGVIEGIELANCVFETIVEELDL